MLGFAAVDRRSDAVAIWLVSRTNTAEASSTNAVVVDLADEHALKKVHSLTRERIVITTPGSDLTGLPINNGHPTTLLEEFIDATRSHQCAIVEAVRSYAAARARSWWNPPSPRNRNSQRPGLRPARTVPWSWPAWCRGPGRTGWSATARGSAAPPSHAPAGPRGSCPGSSTSRSCWPCHLPWRRSFALNPWGPSPAERSRPQPSSTGGSGAYHSTSVRRMRVSTFPSQLTPIPCSWRIGMTTVFISLMVVAS